ncbi:MAG: hypothetical protein H8K04_02960 [Nitrospira sp.]
MGKKDKDCGLRFMIAEAAAALEEWLEEQDTVKRKEPRCEAEAKELLYWRSGYLSALQEMLAIMAELDLNPSGIRKNRQTSMFH